MAGKIDPRIEAIADALSSAGSSEAMPSDQLYRFAEETLAEVDLHSTDVTVRRLQRELWEAWGNDTMEWNLWRAREIETEINAMRLVQNGLKRAFKDQKLDGGWKAALEHPLYVKAEEQIRSLEEELRGLI